MKTFIIGANGIKQIDNDVKSVEVGQIVNMDGYDKRLVVTDITHDSRGYTYHLVDMESFEKQQTDYIPSRTQKGRGIGYCYDDTVAPEFVDASTLAELKAEAQRREDAVEAARRAEEEERNRIETIGAARLRAVMPAGATTVIVAELRETRSDMMSDYFHAVTVRTVILGFSHKSREDFSELRRAAAHFPETEHYAKYNADYEHREKYGIGYFLGKSMHRGWIIHKSTFRTTDDLVRRMAYAAGLEGGIVFETPKKNPQAVAASISAANEKQEKLASY